MSNGRYCCSHLWKIKFAIAWILKSIQIIIGLVLEGESEPGVKMLIRRTKSYFVVDICNKEK